MANNIFKMGYLGKRAVWFNFKHFFKTIKWAWQRATKGYCDFDRWDIEEHLRKTLLGELKDFKKQLNGYPGYMASISDWEKILDKMIYHLTLSNTEVYVNENAEAYHEATKNMIKLNEDYKFVYKYSLTEEQEEIKEKFYNREKEIEETAQEHRKEFFRLLGEYIGDLWD